MSCMRRTVPLVWLHRFWKLCTPCATRQTLQSDQVSKSFQSQTVRSVMHQGHHSAMSCMRRSAALVWLHRFWKLCTPCATRQTLQSDQVSKSFQSQTVRSVMHQGHHSCHVMHETISSTCLVAQILEAVHAMCNTTDLAVRSGLQKLSVTDCQVCDASRTSLLPCHA